MYIQLKYNEAFGIPLTEVDPSVNEQTFCIIMKSWGQTYIHRYNRLPSLHMFHPYDAIRRSAISLTTHVYFDICLMIIVFANLVNLAVPNSLPLLFERITIVFYFLEMVSQTISRGFIDGSYSYLKNPWMCLDFILTLCSLPDLEMNLNKTFGVQALRGIRALQLISRFSGVQTMAEGILLSIKRMFGAALIMFLFLITITLTAKQVFMGVLLHKCVKNLPSDFSNWNISYFEFINDPRNWITDGHGHALICGNTTGAQMCYEGYTCLPDIGSNPNFNYTSFDTFSLSLLNSFRLVSQDEWDDVYRMIIEATGPFSTFFFVPVIFFGSFYLLNLMLVVVISSYDAVVASKEKQNLPLSSFKFESRFQFNIEKLCTFSLPTDLETLKRILKEKQTIVEHEIALRTNWNKVKEIILNKQRKGKNQAEGNENLMEEQGHWLKFRQKIQRVIDHKFFQCFIFLIIAVNAVVLASESSEISEAYQSFLELSNFICTIIFSIEIAVYLIAYGERYFFDWWNIFDFLIIVQCIISIILKNKAEYTIIRTLRMLKLVKLQKFVSLIALQRVVAVVLDSIENIARLIIVMFFLIFLFAVIGNRVLGHYYYAHNPAELPRWSFATFGGSLFTVFRIFSGEWIEPLWNCMRLSNTSILCPFIIISYYLIGHLIILGLFVALLLSSFNMSEFEFSTSKQKELMKNIFQKCYKFFIVCCKKKKKGELQKMTEINDAETHTSQAPSITSNSNTKPQFLEKMVQSITFECIATVMIMGSCVVMAFDDMYIEMNPRQHRIINILNFTFAFVFIFEVFLRVTGIGFKKYFSNAWTVFDFIIVLVSILEIILISVFGKLHGATSVKLLRALRPLRFIPRWKGMQMAVQALLLSFPAIFRVVGVCMFIWLSFAVLGVHFFSGNFFRCVDSNHEMVTEPIVDKDDCIQKNLIWEEPFFTFDHIGISYLSLSQLAMLTGWTGLVQMMVDFKDKDLQPEENSRQEYYIFVVVFILVGGFFSLNLIVGVVVDTFKNKQKHVDDGVTELLLTDAQKGYYNSLLKLSTRRPKVQTEAPTNHFLFFFYKVAFSLWFRVLILLFICTNTVIIAIESYNDSPLKQKILSFCNIAFTIIYIIELAIKLLGLRKFYFKDFWNNFDLVILLAHLAGMLLHTVLKISTGHAQLTFLYVFRLFRVLRLLRLTESLTDLRHLLYSMIASVPALLNISLLLFLIIFIYAIIGMSLFANVEYHGAIGPKINFETALNSMLLLFRLTTSEGWEDILQFISTEKKHCNPSLSNNCELMTAATIFIMSFLFLTNIILVNIFIAVILDNYKEVVAETKSIINEDNLIGFYRIWKQFDPRATQFIPYENLSDFLNQLDNKLRIPKPNDIALSFMNLPIAQGNKVHCLSVLKGILKIKIGNVEDSATFQNLCNKIQGKYEKMFPELKGFRFIETTMQLKRRDHAARIIQMHLRKMRDAKLRKSSLSQ